jgi:hypothetical protein
LTGSQQRTAHIRPLALALLLPLALGGCGTTKPVRTEDLFFATDQAVAMKFGATTPLQGFRLAHSVPDAQHKIAISVAPVATAEQAQAADRVVRVYISQHACPQYSSTHGRYNGGFIIPYEGLDGPYAPRMRKDKGDMVFVGHCSNIVWNPGHEPAAQQPAPQPK